LPQEKYYLQAILDRDLGGISFNSSPGNGYSKPVMVVSKATTATGLYSLCRMWRVNAC